MRTENWRVFFIFTFFTIVGILWSSKASAEITCTNSWGVTGFCETGTLDGVWYYTKDEVWVHKPPAPNLPHTEEDFLAQELARGVNGVPCNAPNLQKKSEGAPYFMYGIEMVRKNIVYTADNATCGANVVWMGFYFNRYRTISCPVGYIIDNAATPATACWSPASVRSKETPETPICSFDGMQTPNPIAPATAEKLRIEEDWHDTGPNPISFTRLYRSSWANDPEGGGVGLGRGWRHNFDMRLKISPDQKTLEIQFPEGFKRIFTRPSATGAWIPVRSADAVSENGTQQAYRDSREDVTYIFSDGKLIRKEIRNGNFLTFSYNSYDRLATVANNFGKVLTFSYDGNVLWQLKTPDLRIFKYQSDSSRLASVTYPDQTVRTYLYERSDYKNALTRILDEAGARFATFSYNNLGQAVESTLAGGAENYKVSYPSPTSAVVVDPLGISRTYYYGMSAGKLAVLNGSLPSGLSDADAATRVQNSDGLVLSETDFAGVTKNTAWSPNRRLPISVIRAVGTADEQTSSIAWHPTFSVPTLVTDINRTTAYTYDVVGNMLSKTVTDATTHEARLWQWTYNAQRLIETATEPNGAVTSYAYDLQGNVLSSTNALGQVIHYTYDTANRIANATAPNGLVTSYTYDLRDRLLTQTIGGQTTKLTYKPYGSVATVTMPIGLVLTYTYDAAHRPQAGATTAARAALIRLTAWATVPPNR